MKHPWFEGHTYNPAENVQLAASGSNKNISNKENPTPQTNTLGSGGRVPGSRAMRIESRKGILSRKSSVNKNSFYKQKSKDAQPNKLYGAVSPGGIGGGVGTIGSGGANRGASSYFNKNGGPMGSSGGGSNLPNVNSRGAPGIQKNSAIGNSASYGAGS